MRRPGGAAFFLAVLASALAFAVLPAVAAFSFHYNENGGFGFYQPEGWRARVNGRRSELKGPLTDFGQSEIAVGSDWVARVHSLEDLRAFAEDSAGGPLLGFRVGGLEGFKVEGNNRGAWFLLREDQNVIEVEFKLRGSAAQREEARLILDSIEIRTGGISYP